MELPIVQRCMGILILILFSQHAAFAAVGRTPGFAAVTPEGEASYSIPLRVPPGTNGLTPQLSLEYRHHSPGGPIGIGWSIGGLSQIARCPRTVAQDGLAAPVPRSDGQRFCLDGQRLVLASGGNYGAAGAEYRTEIESFARIRSVAGAGPAPSHFIVESADGRVLEYGATADSRIDWSAAANPVSDAKVWALNRIRDRSGNVIDFVYAENTTNGNARIIELRYNSNPGAGIAPSHRVSFIYETRNSNEIDSAYVPGTPIRQVVRLDRIDVVYGTTVLRRYELDYESALTASGFSRLATVRECGSNGQDCLAPTTLTWQDGTAGVGPVAAYTTSIPANAGGLPERLLVNTADLNGDGRHDLLTLGGASRSVATIRYRLAQASGALGPEIDSGIACPDGIGAPFDYNADGRSDLLMISATRHWQIVPGTPNGLGAPLSTGVAVASVGDFRGLDMNGDGLGDIAWIERTSLTTGAVLVRVLYASPTGGFASAPVTLYDQSAVVFDEMLMGGEFQGRPGERIDFDRDGADDLVLVEPYSIVRITAQAHGSEGFEGAFVGGTMLDMNGDDCEDLAHVHYSGRLRIRVGGCWPNWDGTELQGPAWSGSIYLHTHDWNDDGREDVLLRGAVNWHVALSNGDSFTNLIDTGVPHEGAYFAVGADVNGDGLRDLLTRAGSVVRVRQRNGPRANLLRAATDGYGVSAAFAYRPLTDSAAYVRGADASWPEQVVQSAHYVVSELARTDGSGTGAQLTTQYAYEGLRRSLQGRGSLGFARRTASESGAGPALSVLESYRQDYPYTGLPSTVVVRQPSGAPLGEASYTWSTLTLGSFPALRHMPYPSKLTMRRREMGGTLDGAEIAAMTHVVSAIDAASGLVTDATTTVTEVAGGVHAGSSSSLRTLHTAVLNDASSWCIGRPLATQVTASHSLAGGNAQTRSLDLTWDAQKCRVTGTRRSPGDGQWQVAVNQAYDAHGNLVSRSITGAGMNSRTTTLQWDARGQSLLRITDPLQQSFQLAWDAATGLPVSVTDPNTLRVGWSYDAHGRPIREEHPQGTSTTWTRTACTAGCDARTRLRIVQLDLDSTGAPQVTTTIDLDQHERAFRSESIQPGGGASVLLVDADARGRPLRRYLPFWAGSSPSGYWQAAYDLLGRTTSISLLGSNGQAQRVHALRHDGLSVAHLDPLGRTTTGTRTAWGTPSQVVDPAGGRTRYEYDAAGRLLRVFDALNNLAASNSYNAVGMPLSQTEMNSGTWTYTHNALGELVSVRDAKAQTIGFAYDVLGRLTGRTAPDGTISFTWGNSAAERNIGRLTAFADPAYSESFSFDGYGRLAARTINADAVYRYDYAYDPSGRLANLSYPAAGSGPRFGLALEYQHGRLTRIRDAASPAVAYWTLGAVDAAGDVVDETRGASLRIVSGFDSLTGLMDYRQSSASGATVQSLTYTWDANDNLTQRRDVRQGITEDFRYDALDRLDDARRNGALNLDLSYDLLGNIRWKSDVCPTASPCYSYHATRRHAATQVAGKVYSYDANGNMTKRAGATIGWNSFNLPTSIAGSSGNSSQFSYGPTGNRWRQIANHAGTAETTIYAGELMEKLVRGTTTTWRHYIPSPGGIAAVHLRDSNGTPPTTRFLTQDHLGSTDRILDSSGSVLTSESFAAFGSRRGPAWNGAPSAADLTAISGVTRDGFTGHEHLDNLGLIHMGGRVYDPQLGRFLSADPHVAAPFNGQSLNRYSYVWNNPLSLVDPSGFDPEVPCVESAPNTCAHITVIGVQWDDIIRAMFAHGGVAGQIVSASQRDPCGQDSTWTACVFQGGIGLGPPAQVVLTAGTQVDATLSRHPDLDRLQGFTARLANLAISAAPVTWLFGADPDFEWFDVPDSAAGRSGANIGNVGHLIGGLGGMTRSAGSRFVGTSASEFAKAAQVARNYTADRFRDITLRKGTILFAGYPGQSAFYTTASALRRADWGAAALFAGLQVRQHASKGLRSRVAMYEVIEDSPVAFGIAIANAEHGAGWLPQIVVPAYERALRYLGDLPLGP